MNFVDYIARSTYNRNIRDRGENSFRRPTRRERDPMEKIKILVVVGSFRKESYNRKLAMAAKELIGDRADFTILEYRDVPFFDQDIEFPAPDAVKSARDAVRVADAIWLFTPEYNHFFPGALKNLIDWLSRPAGKNEPRVLPGKPVTISGISPGPFGTVLAQDHLVTLISYLNMDIMNAPRVAIPNTNKPPDGSDTPAPLTENPFLIAQVDAFLEFIGKRVRDQ